VKTEGPIAETRESLRVIYLFALLSAYVRSGVT
jgi:hypothetical protein